jgi:thiamine phosphate synthase YjbQ (UPF0047 family)
METLTFTVHTGEREVVLDLTRQASSFVAGGGDGLLHVFVPHATAGIAILETGAGSDDRSHVMPAFIPPYATVPVIGGRLELGMWQSICLVDLNIDNPDREVRFSLLRSA